MSYPNFPHKQSAPAVLTPEQLLAHRRRRGRFPREAPPRTVILTFQPSLLGYAAKRGRGKKLGGFLGELYLLRRSGGRLGVAGNFGVGGPVVGVLVSELAAWGVGRFVIIGLAGGLQPDLPPGSLVLAERAIRDDGVSHHYLPPGREVAPPGPLTAHLAQGLAKTLPLRVGVTWSIAAPYRETLPEVLRYQEEGVLTVEMEAAALFGVAQALGVEAGALFSVSDSLAGGVWRPAARPELPQRGLERLTEQALEWLLEQAP